MEINELMDELYENDSQNEDEGDDSQDSHAFFNKPRPMPIK